MKPRARIVAALAVGVVALASAAALEVGARAVLAAEPRVARARRVLAGTEAAWERPRLTAHPTLAWQPNPAHPDHSPQGFRGRPVPLARTPGVRRIVALGPSTVYGYSVRTAAESWPARLEEALRDGTGPSPLAGEGGRSPDGGNFRKTPIPAFPRIAGEGERSSDGGSPPSALRAASPARGEAEAQSVEVVNGGAPAYTSREILLAWLEKFRLWRPDVVLVELGGNDAASYFRPGWTPDGAHYRRVWEGPRRLSGLARALAARSALVGGFAAARERPWVLGMFLAGAPSDFAAWYPPLPGEPWRAAPSSDLPLAAHADALLSAIARSGARAVVVPFALSPRDDLAAAMAAEYGGTVPELRAAYARDRAEVLAAAARACVPVALGWEAAIDDGRWTDGCHLDAAGERAKALALLPWVERALGAGGRGPGPSPLAGEVARRADGG